MIAIPAIDVIDGKVVRLFQGDYTKQTAYAWDPFAYALEIKKSGIEHLHLVDLSGAKAGKVIHLELLKKLSTTELAIDFGGGVKSKEDVEKILQNGASQVVIGSLCVTAPETVLSWIAEMGTERFILALDTDGTYLKINGWQQQTDVTLDEIMTHFQELDGLRILTTDIRKDGTGSGPNVGLYRDLVKRFPNQRWIASGGVETITDLEALRQTGCYGSVVGKSLLDGKITLNELNRFNNAGI